MAQEEADGPPRADSGPDLARLFFPLDGAKDKGREASGEGDPSLFALTPNVLLPEALECYRLLGLKPEQPLRLIAPAFACPQPSLR